MTFIWPTMLYSLLVIPLLVAVYLRLLRRQRLLANHFQPLSGEPTGQRTDPGLRRHLPPILFLLSLVVLLVALARPQAEVSLPRVEGTVILVIDVSASMRATDVDPSRLDAAKEAARQFVLHQPATLQIGIVSFSSSGFSIQAPTNDANALLGAIDRLQPTSGTSLGQGILTALNVLAVDSGLVSQLPDPLSTPSQQLEPGGRFDRDPLGQLPEGNYPASAIVLLSDGEDNESIDPLIAAQTAGEHDVPVHALGFGATGGTTVEVDEFTVFTALNEPLLQQITQAAGGRYFPAQGQQDPQTVFASLTPELVVKPEAMELTSLLAGLGILLLVLGSLFSMVWFNRVL